MTRYCCHCRKTYPRSTIHCSMCGSEDTYETFETHERPTPLSGVCTVCHGPRAALCACVETDFDPKTQETLFDIPAPPKPNLWRIETRWKDLARVDRLLWRKPDEWTLDPEKNVWRPWLKYDISIEKSARSKAARHRQVWKWQSFRVVIVGYEKTPGFDNGEILFAGTIPRPRL